MMDGESADLITTSVTTKPTNHPNDDGNVSFKWSQNVSRYGDKLLHRLNEFRKKSTFYDIVLKMSDGDLPAHKVVLIACGGVFRTQFVDPETKMIYSNITEVPIKCTKVGIQPILNFAYSGYLQITESTLFPVLKAATITEMREVRDICLDITKTRLSWLLVFDGTEKTCSCVNIENVKPPQVRKSLDLNESLNILFGLLNVNVSNFSPVSDEVTIDNGMEMKKYPCLEVINKEHPELASVYKKIIDCLRKEKIGGAPEIATNVILATKDKGELAKPNNTKLDQVTLEKKESNEKLKVATNNPGSAVNEDTHAVKVQQKVENTDEKVKEEKSLQESPNDQSIDTAVKITEPPQSKPRTMSLSTAVVKTPPPPPSTKKAARRHSPPQSIEITKPNVESTDIKTRLNVSTSKNSAPRSPVPAKRKSAAPKPPPHPPASNNKTPHKPAPPVPPATAKVASKSSQKIPPPRPKPPSVKKKAIITNDVYDDALNPFSFDDAAALNDDDTALEDSYNSELNPFS